MFKLVRKEMYKVISGKLQKNNNKFIITSTLSTLLAGIIR